MKRAFKQIYELLAMMILAIALILGFEICWLILNW